MKELELLLSDLIVFRHKIQLNHWNVKGPNFFTLHEEFETDYDKLVDLADDLAEKIIQDTNQVVIPLKYCLENTSIEETSFEGETAFDMVNTMIQDMTAIVNYIENITKNDPTKASATEDIMCYFNKRIWMYSSYLEGSE